MKFRTNAAICISRCVQSEMTGVENVDFRIRHVLAVAFRLSRIEREIVLAPNHQQARLLLAHPGLPFWVGVNVRPIIVKQIALDLAPGPAG